MKKISFLPFTFVHFQGFIYLSCSLVKESMNISLGPKAKKAKKIVYGLSNRGGGGGSSRKKNVFGDSSSSEDEADNATGMARVNREIVKEQEALRKRAQAAAASMEKSVYDYDGVYDSFQNKESPKEERPPEERKSRYIGDLLKAAKKRERERDVIHERQIAKEQAEEERQADYVGKEKFVTKAYRRKLEERKLWEQEQKEREREEEENDVTKKKADVAFANFYGNFNRNVAMGGKGNNEEGESKDSKEDDKGVEKSNATPGGLGFLSGFERSSGPETADLSDTEGNKAASPKLSIREIREKKVQEARKRYLERKATTFALQ